MDTTVAPKTPFLPDWLKINLRHMPMASILAIAVACAPNGDNDVATRALSPHQTLPPMKTFVSHQNGRTLRSNADLVTDFMDLNFRMETGRQLTALSRFEGPITVRVNGAIPSTLPTDLSRLIQRLRNEAGLNIALTDKPSANIQINLLAGSTIAREVPGAACFVVPNVTDWNDFTNKRRAGLISWASITQREQVAIFVPNDTSPQDLRDCLHEELAQAIGPLNDLYRLPDSTFNDDNFHSVLTSFDMLMLRTAYDPSLKSGMSRDEVQSKLSKILARLNPAGQTRSGRSNGPTNPDWSRAMLLALSNSSVAVRREAARKATSLRTGHGHNDVRDGFAHYALGLLTIEKNDSAALQSLNSADAIFANLPDANIHRAMVAEYLGVIHLRRGNGPGVMNAVNPYIQTALKHENAELLSTLLMLRAEGLELMGRTSEAQLVRMDSLGWARYGYGSDRKVFDRLKLIQSWNPTNG